MLQELNLKGVSSAPKIDVEFADRLNILVGDKESSKTFLLNLVWYSLTRTWIDNQPLPTITEEIPFTSCSLVNRKTDEYKWSGSRFDFQEQRWSDRERLPSLESLVVYIHADNRFSIFDPARNFSETNPSLTCQFDCYTLWAGLKYANGQVLCNGLIHDWAKWQKQCDQSNFQLLSRIIRQFSSSFNELIEPGELMPASLVEYGRDIPTIKLPPWTVPVTHLSVGMKRILGLAYLLVWTWSEHLQASKLQDREPLDQIVLLVDEVEFFLKLQWQRSIVPALLRAVMDLHEQINVQAFVTTCSPLILASLETFHEDTDKLFLFQLQDEKVVLNELPWAKQGDVVRLLTPEVPLKQTRSEEAEFVISAAEAYMRGEHMHRFPENLRTEDQIHQQLERLLSEYDSFWLRWADVLRG
jgi:hypothetical protein